MTCERHVLCRAQDLLNSPDLYNNRYTVKYLKAMAKAADQSGINFCAALVVQANLGASPPLFYSTYHVGPQPDEPDGCLPNFQQASAPPGASDPSLLPLDRTTPLEVPGSGQSATNRALAI